MLFKRATSPYITNICTLPTYKTQPPTNRLSNKYKTVLKLNINHNLNTKSYSTNRTFKTTFNPVINGSLYQHDRGWVFTIKNCPGYPSSNYIHPNISSVIQIKVSQTTLICIIRVFQLSLLEKKGEVTLLHYRCLHPSISEAISFGDSSVNFILRRPLLIKPFTDTSQTTIKIPFPLLTRPSSFEFLL